MASSLHFLDWRCRARLHAFMWFVAGVTLTLFIQSWIQGGSLPPTGAPLSTLAMRALSAASKRPRVVVSFTTFPVGKRMAAVGKVLATMANQTWRPDAVIINFPDHIARFGSQKLEIPSLVKDWQRQYSFLRIHQTEDYGPATKLLGALEVETDPDTIIVIIDDDTYYHKDTVLALVSAMLASPTDVMPCFECEMVRKTLRGVTKWQYVQTEGECRGFADGYASYAVRPRYFDHSLWDFSLGPSGCRLHDDVWISGRMLVGSGVRPYLVRPGFSSIIGEYIKEAGTRQAESVNVAQKAAEKVGRDPQRECVDSFSFLADVGKSTL